MLTALSQEKGFDPRLREGGDSDFCEIAGPMVRFRSTPPRGRRLTRIIGWPPGKEVSIHASAREATKLVPVVTRAPPFRSTPPRGRRLPLQALNVTLLQVSIHASAREATMSFQVNEGGCIVSIHASAREAT